MPYSKYLKARSCRLLLAAALTVLPINAALAEASALITTPVKYQLIVNDKLPVVRNQLISALEARNYAIINQLNVQEGLLARGIAAPPLQLIEFCNLTRAFTITSHVPDFEMFAPCRLALIEEGGKTRVMVLRPAFVLSLLAQDANLSADGKASLEQFDRDLADILNELASGGF